MDEAEKILGRLRRIQELDNGRAAPAVVLGELRELVAEAESWARVEGDARARAAALELGEAMGRVSSLPRDEPVRDEPVRDEPVRDEPVRDEPVRAEPVRAEGVRLEQVAVS